MFTIKRVSGSMLIPGIIQKAIAKGAKLYSNISGGKDGQAMTAQLLRYNLPVEALIHADLGKAEWPQSIDHC